MDKIAHIVHSVVIFLDGPVHGGLFVPAVEPKLPDAVRAAGADEDVPALEPGGHILDPFSGSGTTVLAAVLEGYTATGIEVTDEYARRARERIAKEVGVYEDLSGVAS